MQTFVDFDWLQARRSDPDLRIVDTRSVAHGIPGLVMTSAAEQYAAGHLPGAVHLDYFEDLADPATPYAGRVAPAERFARVIGAKGIGDTMTIVAYDAGDAPYAARLVWMCRYYGHDDVAILAGGYNEWVSHGLPVSKDVPQYAQATFSPRVRPSLRASREEVLAIAEGRSDAQLLETQRDKTYAMRDRDIAGSIRLSGSQLLEDARGGRIAAREKLDALVLAAELNRNKRTIVSCGSGVSASGAYLALLAAGFSDVAVYDGSWLEWNHDGLPTVPKTAER